MSGVVLSARETNKNSESDLKQVMVERGERDKDNYRYILLSCILAVITRHNGALGGKVPDVPEAIRKASQEESHLKNGRGEVCQKDKEME